MAENEDKSSKTEAPTPSRLRQAREKGDLVKSQDVPVWFLVLALTALALVSGPIASRLAAGLVIFLDQPHAYPLRDPRAAAALLPALGRGIAVPLALIFGVVAAAALAGHLVQNRPVWTLEKLKPKLDKISPVAGFRRLFGAQSRMNLFKAVMKLTAILVALGIAIWPRRELAGLIGAMPLSAFAGHLGDLVVDLALAALVSVGAVAAVDYAWQRHDFMRRMRMSRRDVRDETKQSEGDPEIRARLRAIRRERARGRMMAAVPDATVVIANPRHYAVALKYEAEPGAAPVCVAQGVDELALRIRAAAEAAGVPVVVDPALARALYASTELDRPIPVEHYEAVAKVIGFVMRTKIR